MNLQQLKPSRKRPSAGDVFTMKVNEGPHLYGRVIGADAKAGWSMSGSLLIYIYSFTSDRSLVPARAQLRREDLLVPPMMTNAQPWSKGYFETVASLPLEPGEVLGQHCFRSSSGKYYDELCNEIPREIHPCGDWGLHSFRTIDDEISDALGIPRSE